MTRTVYLISVLMIWGCSQNGAEQNELDPFLINPEISKSGLLYNGYTLSDDGMEVGKMFSDYGVSYDVLPTTDVVYGKRIYYRSMAKDDFDFDTWCRSRFLVPFPWDTLDNGVVRTFVKSRSTAIVFEVYIKNSILRFYYDYPDYRDRTRSFRRTIDANGSVLIRDSTRNKTFDIRRSPNLE